MEKIILYGASELGKLVFQELREDNDIVFFCDSSESKWGNEFCGLKIISPSELSIYNDCRILITTSYFKEVSEKLINLGIEEFEIFYFLDYEVGLKYDFLNNNYFIRKIRNKNEYYDFVINYSPIKNIINFEQKNIFAGTKFNKMIKKTNDEYIFNKQGELNEIKSKNKYTDKFLIHSEVLIICPYFSIHTSEYVKNMYKYSKVKFDILFYNDNDNYNYNCYDKISKDIINKLYPYRSFKQLLSIVESIGYYDIIHVHYLSETYGIIGKCIRAKCEKLVITIWGSDFNFSSNRNKEIQRFIVEEADAITFDNAIVRDDFIRYYGEKYLIKTFICLFGIVALEYINKINNIDRYSLRKKYHIPESSVVITCGSNPKPMQHHLEIIRSIKKIKARNFNHIFLIFPMTYGKDSIEHINAVKHELKISNLKYLVIEEFMSFDELAEIRKISDIMIQVQTNDTLSVTMQEYLYCNNIIITGKWLPYKKFKDLGIKYFEVESINKIEEQITELTEYIVNNLNSIKDNFKSNKNIIWKFSSWQNVYKSWSNIYYRK